MKLVYGTNIWSHHQAPVARELARLLGPNDFRMVLFEDVHEERRAMGWPEREDLPWVLGPPNSADSERAIAEACLGAEVMVFGDCPHHLLEARAAAGKLTLVASERMLRKPLHELRMLNPRYALGISRYRRRTNHPRVHALTMGQHAPKDLRRIGAFGNRIWRWGYLAELPPDPPAPRAIGPLKIMWAGRMLKWKRVDTLLRAVALLGERAEIGECLVVGDGPERDRLQRLAGRLELAPPRVRFEPPVQFGEVRGLMRRADVYVFPSNHLEGWGVVANEAMSEGCVLVANEEAGASRELVVDGRSGLLFRDGDVAQLAGHLARLSRDHETLERLRRAAWERIATSWSPREAAKRLVALCAGLQAGKPPLYVDGPCSRPD